MYKIKLKIKGCKTLKNLKKFIELNKINLVLFGEYHGFTGQLQIQEKIIQSICPKFFLYEMLEDKEILNNKDAKKFLDKPNKENFSVVSDYGDLKPIIKLARKFNLPIIGCDIKNMGVGKDWKRKKFSREESNKITKKRELQQAKVINEYANKGLVFGLVGEHHLRKNSFLLDKLKAKKYLLWSRNLSGVIDLMI